ncbi:MAG TPA: hypothetical protein ENI49_03850, partial [Thermoplasmatales archaeon]|nr:hypothetical protein [Thermoplasmatales archaeon]
GPNNAGKSNIMKALSLILGESHPAFVKYEETDFYKKQKDEPFRIQVFFEDNYEEIDSFVLEGIYGEKNSNFYAYDIWGNEKKYVTKELREKFALVTIDANRNLQYHLGYSSKWTFMSRIARCFDDLLKSGAYEDQKRTIEESFDAIKQAFLEVQEFSDFETDLKRYFREQIKEGSYDLELNFEAYNPINYFKSLQLIAKEDGELIDLSQLGDGMKNLLMLAFFRSYAKSFRHDAIIAIEEPEIYLHPHARRHLYKVFRELAKSGTQIFYTTHSSSFIDVEYFDEVGLVTKESNGSTKVRFVSTKDLVDFCHKTGATRATEENIRSFYKVAYTPRLSEGFFANKIVLVEGATEEFALPIYLKALGCDIDLEGISIISVNGKNNLARYYRLFKAFGIPVHVIFDNDLGENEKYKSSNEELMNIFSLTEEEIYGINIALVKGEVTVLEEDFETALRKGLKFEEYEYPFSYEELERRVKEEIQSDSKPLIARCIANKVTGNGEFELLVPEFIESLRKVLTGHEEDIC